MTTRVLRGLLRYACLSRVQAIIGVLTGLISIAGAVYSFVPGVKPVTGEVVAVVREAGSEKPISGASIEILTRDDALVTTVTPQDNGRAQQTVKEGPYRVRVSHPRYATDVRPIEVVAGQTTELRVRLVKRANGTAHGAGRSSVVDGPQRAINSGLNALRDILD